MRLTIVAGLLAGVSLAFQSAHAAHTKAIVTHAPVAVRAVSAPWYIATNASHSEDLPKAGPLRKTDAVNS